MDTVTLLGLVQGGPRVRDADQEYAAFYRGEYSGVARTVFLILHDRGRAEEIAQDAFVQLFSHWNKVSRYQRPDAWVRRVAIRLAVRVLKRERVRAVLEREIEPPPPPGPVDLDLLRAIARLSPLQRAVVVLFYFEDRPSEEIAGIVGSTDRAVRVALHRARHRLAELLGEVADVD